jgi:hypothetical protein
VIGFDRIISVSLGDMAGGRHQLVEYPRVGGRVISGDLNRGRPVFTGIRVEELTEHSLVQYRLTNTLAITPPRPTKHHQALPHHANLAVIADNRWPPQS